MGQGGAKRSFLVDCGPTAFGCSYGMSGHLFMSNGERQRTCILVIDAHRLPIT